MGIDRWIEDWLRFTLISGVGGATQRKLLTVYGTPGEALSASPGDLARFLSSQQREAWARGPDAAAVASALEWAGKSGHHVVSLGDPHYPPQLLLTEDPPPLLYVKGHVDLLSKPGIAVVGSRNATPLGIETAAQFARSLSDAGLTVVSGLALGIDAAAHAGGLDGTGSTVAVVGTGLDLVYPARNRSLAHRIADKGAIVSEFALGTRPMAANFPRRNRIISGLSKGVLVVEAALKSGSLTTARCAAEQGREVFAIPGSIHSPLSKGCHALIKQGAKLVESAADVLEEFGMLAPAQETRQVESPGTSDPVLNAMGYDPCDAETIAERAGLAIAEVTGRLLELELAGDVSRLPGGKMLRMR
ncbi:MAG: DNA-protecting protein DprA [Betaproteobacteria bacterium]|nr:DNA-protecting protein DprA [Betaproteobacteria bacterium]